MKKDILLNILELTKQQKEAIQEKDVEKFDELVEVRQKEMNKIDELHKQNPEYQQEKYNELLKEIIQIDQENIQAYKLEMNSVKNKLNNMRSTQRVNQAYNSSYGVLGEEGIFFDKGR